MNLNNGLAAVACSLFMLAAHAGDFLSGDEITSTFSGKTGIGQHLKKEQGVKTYFAEDGTFSSVLSGGVTRKGTWWVDDKLFCVRINGETKDRCRSVRKDGSGGYELVKKKKKELVIIHYESVEDGDQT